jgi:parallel beta-helix repeat protein
MRKILFSLVILSGISIISIWVAYGYINRTPGELLRYAERRIAGHPKIQFFTIPIFDVIRPQIERPIQGPFPNLDKGQQTETLALQRYGVEGQPLSTTKLPTNSFKLPENMAPTLNNSTDILQAISAARPGQTIEIASGTYTFSKKIHVKNAGLSEKPIIVRAQTPGTVEIKLASVEGFYITAPYWIFENLVIRGICEHDSNCEHAFHIVGRASNTVIRNNRIEDFNAQIKVNGMDEEWPDNGLIQFNTISNNRARKTANPVTPIDIVGANKWTITDNIIRNFIKESGDQISYGVFMKGGGNNGRIEHNLIECTDNAISQMGVRVGLSFGGGGTGAYACRDKRCILEHSQGIAANNIISNCNDFGIYINKSNQSQIINNTLINTYGIDIRFPSSSAEVYGNLLEGTIRTRDGGISNRSNNKFISIDTYTLETNNQELIPTHKSIKGDFFHRNRDSASKAGAIN